MKIKKNDKVIVISGKDKNKIGIVQKVFPKTNKIIVENINIHKCYKKNKSQNEKEKKNISIFSAPIDVSNVKLIDPKTNQSCKIGYVIKEGKKKRINKITKENV